ncbi:MAG: xanthine dehydrogenase FAD-binding subunit XdhB [Treponema sp.]|jgi:xanthine dehydrogenase FAD-binding subunit|nr:xanthine dehydrogenase FAD-binding subunit XdhB [Treponema sp.]
MYSVKELFQPESLAEALRLMKGNDLWPVAGATDVLIKMRHDRLKDVSLLSLLKIPDLMGIGEEADGAVSIGAACSFSAIAANELIQRKAPMLKDAALSMGGPQIQNVATIGGNICNGAVSADSAPALLALGAMLVLEESGGRRTVPVTEFYAGPGKTVRKKEELLTRIILPLGARGKWGGVYIKVAVRKAMDISTLGVAALCEVNRDGTIKDAALALGTAAPTPVRCREAEKLLLGKIPDKNLLAETGRAAKLACNPRSSWRAGREYRLALIEELSGRAVQQAYDRAVSE